MNHIRLDAQDDAVKRFFLSLPVDARGSVVELNGRAVACVLPPPAESDDEDADSSEWTETKNARRCALIDREIAGILTADETVELHGLQREMLNSRRRLAPRPLEDARRLHQELQAKAAQGSTTV